MESCHLTAYPDSGGWSIGFGHHGSDVYKGMKISMEQALAYLKQDLAGSESCVNRNLAGVSLNQNQFDALVSMAYNRGCTGFAASDPVKLLKQGDYNGAATAWLTSAITAKSVIQQGLIKRRKMEAELFNGGTVGEDITVQEVNEASMIPDEDSSTVGTVVKVGLVAAAAYGAYKYGYPYIKKQL